MCLMIWGVPPELQDQSSIFTLFTAPGIERGDMLFGNIDSFLIWNLTGGAQSGNNLSDTTNAGRTQLMNLQ